MLLRRSLWSESATVFPLLAGVGLLVCLRLGAAELWTLEGRWAGICLHMVRSGDYLHPYLFDLPYYDKPLLSYWLMVVAARAIGRLNELALRLPDAFSGILTVWCTYRIGCARFNRTTGLIAGYLLSSCYMFVYWSRVASADMLNVAGTVAAVAWYFERKQSPGFATFAVFFLILALTALMKGLIGPAIVVLVLVPDLIADKAWRRFLKPSLVPAAAVALGVYIVPFLLSSLREPAGYAETGLGMVFRENAVRYFDAFDHQQPLYTYFIDAPIYLLPWSLFLPLVISNAVRRWGEMSRASRWAAWSCLLIFVFLTVSSSRRSYYVLPLVPFATLMIADWLASAAEGSRRERVAGWTLIAASVFLLLWFGAAVPFGFHYGGQRQFARLVREAAEKEAPWDEWEILNCGAPPSVGYYIRTAAELHTVEWNDREAIRSVLQKHPRTILVTKRRFLDDIHPLIPDAGVVVEPPHLPPLLSAHRTSERDLIALIP